MLNTMIKLQSTISPSQSAQLLIKFLNFRPTSHASRWTLLPGAAFSSVTAVLLKINSDPPTASLRDWSPHNTRSVSLGQLHNVTIRKSIGSNNEKNTWLKVDATEEPANVIQMTLEFKDDVFNCVDSKPRPCRQLIMSCRHLRLTAAKTKLHDL